jgi:hypothetical protein
MKATGTAIMEMESVSEGQTKLYWSNSGNLIYPINIMIPMMERSIGKDMESSLLNLKVILEPQV